MEFADIPWLAGLPALLGHTEPVPLPPATMLIIVLAAAAVSIPPATWRVVGLFTTLVHELGHAFAALLTGRRVTGIQIHRNHAGSARSLGRGVLSTVVSGFFGYPAPAIVGAALLWCVINGYTATALAAGTAIILLTALFIRNAFGFVVVLVSAAASGSLWYFASPAAQSWALTVVAVSLLVGSVRALANLIGVHTTRRRQLQDSDAYLLAQRTRIPSFLWLLLFAAVIAASVLFAVETYIGTLG